VVPPAWAERVARRLRRVARGGPGAEPGPDAPVVAPAPPRVVVVTDSTSCLTAADAAAWGIDVVPLDVAADGERFRDGVDLTPEGLVAALESGRRVTTSQPPPAAFAAAYEAAAARGAAEVVSVHLSGELSGTVRAAGLAAQLAPLPVHVVDSRSAGLGLGFAALAAAEAARGTVWGPADGASVAGAAEQVGRSTAAWFVVDSLDHLRRGGRLSAAAAAFGTVLGLRPVLALRDGRIEVAERVRTRRAARDRLHALAVAEVARRVSAGSGPGSGVRGAGGVVAGAGAGVDAGAGAAGGAPGVAGGDVGPGAADRAVRVGVQHLGRPEVAEEVAARLRAALGLDEVLVREVGAVLGGHLGVGAVAGPVTDW
jgi:DegV family protein with EDD domain